MPSATSPRSVPDVSLPHASSARCPSSRTSRKAPDIICLVARLLRSSVANHGDQAVPRNDAAWRPFRRHWRQSRCRTPRRRPVSMGCSGSRTFPGMPRDSVGTHEGTQEDEGRQFDRTSAECDFRPCFRHGGRPLATTRRRGSISRHCVATQEFTSPRGAMGSSPTSDGRPFQHASARLVFTPCLPCTLHARRSAPAMEEGQENRGCARIRDFRNATIPFEMRTTGCVGGGMGHVGPMPSGLVLLRAFRVGVQMWQVVVSRGPPQVHTRRDASTWCWRPRISS
jgi:hypothetical protein